MTELKELREERAELENRKERIIELIYGCDACIEDSMAEKVRLENELTKMKEDLESISVELDEAVRNWQEVICKPKLGEDPEQTKNRVIKECNSIIDGNRGKPLSDVDLFEDESAREVRRRCLGLPILSRHADTPEIIGGGNG